MKKPCGHDAWENWVRLEPEHVHSVDIKSSEHAHSSLSQDLAFPQQPTDGVS